MLKSENQSPAVDMTVEEARERCAKDTKQFREMADARPAGSSGRKYFEASAQALALLLGRVEELEKVYRAAGDVVLADTEGRETDDAINKLAGVLADFDLWQYLATDRKAQHTGEGE